MMFKLNEDDVRYFSRALERNLRRGAARMAVSLAVVAQRFLWRGYSDEGWRDLAKKWDHTGVTVSPDEVSIEVYNRAENERIFGRTTRRDIGRVRTTKYQIEGDRLISILEYGAKAHVIAARDAEALAFPADGSDLDARTFRHVKMNGPGSFLKPSEGDVRFVNRVDHPGVSGAFILRRAEAAALEAVDRIADAELDDL